MVDRVRPMKMETDVRGTEIDEFHTPVDPSEDHIEARGFFIQNDTSEDEVVLITRDSSNRMTLEDTENSPITLSQLLTEGEHKTVRQLIHFIEEGPAEGFASGAYKETLPSANPFPTSIIWWESSSKLKKIVERTITWTGANPTTDEWKIYDADGSTVLATVSDAISYSGPFETTRTRTITVS